MQCKTPPESNKAVVPVALEPEAILSRELRRLLFLFLLAAAVLIVFHLGPFATLVHDVERLRNTLDRDGFPGQLLYLLAVVLLVALGTPRLVLFGCGGLLFGFWQGLFLAQAGALIGSCLTFQAVRWGGRRWVMHRLGSRPWIHHLVRIPPSIEAVALIRQLPLSNFMINIGLGLSAVNARAFLAGSFVGFLPQGIVAVLIGSGLAAQAITQLLAPFLVAALVISTATLLLLRERNSVSIPNSR